MIEKEVGHDHYQQFAEWSFPVARDQGVLIAMEVVEGGAIVAVEHDDDGDWVFLGEATSQSVKAEDLILGCIGCFVGARPEAALFSDLPMTHVRKIQDDGTHVTNPMEEE